ncbi:MAG: putative oxidoreductase, coenzyme F420-dependent [Gemmatimonadetes bacterium]|nr:putative oxidoreductase, coenzyme F420-dependent [Gemmatimonadota bacterium]
MNIGILGSGDVGQTLGLGLAAAGHEVVLGTRDPAGDKAQAWAARAGGRGRAGTFAEAAAFGEVVVLATLWSGTENALRLAGAENLAGKVVMDATNPLDFSQGAPRLALGHTDSGGEQVQRWVPSARVVKAFNTVGSPHMVNPDFPGGPPDMLIAGDHDAAKATVSRLAGDLGWPTVDLGGIDGARFLEPLAMAWVVYGFRTGTWNHAFKLLRG